ncbi:unnamed protein product [Aphanomyces euteiches]|nr:hypothetical protein AeRB84_000815 [Aphanomyces euteiches]
MARATPKRWTAHFVKILFCLAVWPIVCAEVFYPDDVPNIPSNVLVLPVNQSAVRVQVQAPSGVKPLGSNGVPVLGYKIDVATRVPHVHTFSIQSPDGPITGGSYRLSFTNRFGTSTSFSCIRWNATSDEFLMALQSLSNVDGVIVTRSDIGAVPQGYVYTITFTGPVLSNGAQTNVLTGSAATCAPFASVNRRVTLSGAHVTTGAQGFVPEVWQLSSSESSLLAGITGTFDLSIGFEGNLVSLGKMVSVSAGSKVATTTPGNSLIGIVSRGDVIVIAGERFRIHATAPFTDSVVPLDSKHIRGANNVAVYGFDTMVGRVSVVQGSASVSTAADYTGSLKQGDAIQIAGLEFTVNAITAISLTLGTVGDATTTTNWPSSSDSRVTLMQRKKATFQANVEPTDLATQLTQLPGVGSVQVRRFGPTAQLGYQWLITFESLGPTSCPQSPCLHLDTHLLNEYGATCNTCSMSLSRYSSTAGVLPDYSTLSSTTEIGGAVFEVQSITTSADVSPIGGYFYLNFQSYYTSPASPGVLVKFDDTADDIATKLESLPTIGNVTVTRAPLGFGFQWLVTFLSNMGNQPLLSVDYALLTGINAAVTIAEVTRGVAPQFEAIVGGLPTNTSLGVRAFSKNAMGYSAGSDTMQQYGRGASSLVAKLMNVPDAPKITSIWPISFSQLGLSFTPPSASGGLISRYRLEATTDSTFGTPQILAVDATNPIPNDTYGTFQLTYGGLSTQLFSMDASAGTMEAAINLLPNLRPVTVSRSIYVLLGSPTSRVTAFSDTLGTLSTTSLTAAQIALLPTGCTVIVNQISFVVTTAPLVGDVSIKVTPSVQGTAAFPALVAQPGTYSLLRIDMSGNAPGAFGYRWLVKFGQEPLGIDLSSSETWSVSSTLASIAGSGALLPTPTVSTVQPAQTSPLHYTSLELSAEPWCNTYITGTSSPMQVIQFFASTTITAGSYKLTLDQQSTACISFNAVASGTPTSMKTLLEALPNVNSVSVEERTDYKTILLPGSATSKVTAFDAVNNVLSLVSTGSTGGLTAAQATSLSSGSIVRVAKNPTDIYQDICDFQVTASAVLNDVQLSVSLLNPTKTTCTAFTGDVRSLAIFEMKSYRIVFQGDYPTGKWPTLQVTSLGTGACAAFAPSVPVRSRVTTLLYEGACSSGNPEVQTLIADADTAIGGTFSLSYGGQTTPPLSVTTSSTTDITAAIQSLVPSSTSVIVTTNQYNSFGRAWQITFSPTADPIDVIQVNDAFLTGLNAEMHRYPAVEFVSTSQLDSLRGSFSIALGGEMTGSLGCAATMGKVLQALQSLNAIYSVLPVANIATDTNQIGFTQLQLTVTAVAGSNVLSGIQYKGAPIDPSIFLAIADSITIGTGPGETRTVVGVSSIDVTLDQNMVAAGSLSAAAGMLLSSTKAAPGVISTLAATIVSATIGSPTLILQPGHGWSINDVVSINGVSYSVLQVGGDGVTITLQTNYVGPAVVSSIPSLQAFKNQFVTSSDLTSMLAVGSKCWFSWPDGTTSEFVVSSPPSSRLVTVTGVVKQAIFMGKLRVSAGGYRYPIVFKSFSGDIKTIDAFPNPDWTGYLARLQTRRPHMTAPNTFTLGNPSQRQSVKFSATNVAAIGTGTTYTLTFRGETTSPIAWGAIATTPNDVKTALEALTIVDGVSVTSSVLGNGFMLIVTFWGTDYNIRTLPLMSSTLQVGANGDATQISIVHNIMTPSFPVTGSWPYYTSLASSTAYLLRVSASNEMGYGQASTVMTASTAMVAVLPSVPRGVTLSEHGPTWLGVSYRAPSYMGGAPINMYRVEWSSSASFDAGTGDYRNIKRLFEVQEVLSTFRSAASQGGTFTLSFGGFTTNPLPAACTAAQMTTELVAVTGNMNTEGTPIVVSRTVAGWGFSWKVTFMANLGNLANLRVDYTMLQGDFPQMLVREVTQGTQDIVLGDFTFEVQDVFTSSASPIGGTFTLSYNGFATQPIGVKATALEMQRALEALPTIDSAKVTKTVISSTLNTAVWSVTFANVVNNVLVGSGNIFRMLVDSTAFTSGSMARVDVAEKVKGTNPFRFRISDLISGSSYYVRVMAYNSQGFGSNSSPYAVGTPRTQPGPPLNVSTNVQDRNALVVSWSPPAVSGGLPVDQYKVEWFRGAGQPVQQTITTSATQGIQEIQRITNFASSPSLTGYFTLTFQGYTTGNIAWNALPTGSGSVKERLERLPSVGSVTVSRSTSLKAVANLYVILSTTTTAVAQAPITDVSTCCGFNNGDTLVIAGQTRTITGLAAGGTTITLSADPGLTTTPVQVFRSANGYQWTVTFGPMHVGDVPALLVSPSDNWGGTSPGIYVSTVQDGIAPISGTFRLTVPLSVNGIIMSEQTPPLPYNISDVALQSALEALSTVASVTVTRSVNGFGYNWYVLFVSESAADVQLIVPDGDGLIGPNVAIAASITQAGTPPTLYCESNGIAGSSHLVSSSATLTDVIPNLVTGVPYMTRVRAHTSEGWGLAAWGNPQFQVPRGPPTVPFNVVLMTLSSTLVKVAWTAPQSSGGSTISAYRIEWDSSATFANVALPGFNYVYTYVISSTTQGPTYFYNIPVAITTAFYVRVYALNDRGQSPAAYSVPASIVPTNVPPGPPQTPQLIVLSSTGYFVTWKPPSTNLPVFGGTGGLPVTQYMVEWDVSSTFDSPASFVMITGDQNEYVIGGRDVLTGVTSQVLTPGGTYFVRITAFNGLGASPATATVPPSLALSDQVPWPPQALNLTGVTSSSVLGQWTTPRFDGGASIRKYTLQYDSQQDYMSGGMVSVDVPVVHEQQMLQLATDPICEEQNVEATVQVTNERQTVRTTVVGVDEIQVVTTTCAPVVDEIQTVTTTATDRNEVQTLTLTGTDIDERQAVRTNLGGTAEVQTVTIGVSRVNAVQSFTLGFTGISSPSSITGTLILGLDTTRCAFCPVKVVLQTVDVTSAVTETSDTSGLTTTMANLLVTLQNIDSVSVSRVTTVNNVANTLTMVFEVTFVGLKVPGRVPLLNLQSTLGPLIPLTSVQTSATEVLIGSQPTYNAASLFKLYYTCEQYSDPTQTLTPFVGISTACQPTNQLCAACATAFDGTNIAVNVDLSSTVAVGAVLQIGPCVYGISGVTASQLTVDVNNVGMYCSRFTGKSFAVYTAKVLPTITNLVMNQGSGSVMYPETATVIAGQFLNSLSKAVAVVATPVISNSFVGTSYAITFSGQSGTVPLMTCDASSMVVTSGTKSCTVARTTLGSMIYGTFTLSLPRVSDGVVFTSPPMAFDISAADIATTLASVGAPTELVFGTVTVTRSAFPISGNLRWTGGFTWRIQFTSRGWNIPTVTLDASLLLNTQGATPLPVAQVEDGANLLTPPAGSVDGNQVGGQFLLSFNGVNAAAPCVIGTTTDNTQLTSGPTIPDTRLQAYLMAQFGFPSITVQRSLPTQAMGFTWFITFIDKDTGGDVSPLVITSTPASLTGSGAAISNAELIKGNQISGTFQLQFNGQTTGPISFSATPGEVADQINSLDSIRPSMVQVTRTGPYGPSTGIADANTQVLAYQWQITFRSSTWKDPTSDHSVMTPGNWIGPPATWTDVWETGYSKAWGRQVGPLFNNGFAMQCLSQGLTTTANDGSAACSVSLTRTGVGPLKGTFQLRLDSTSNPYMRQGVATSTPIAHNAWGTAVQSRSSGASMEEILESMVNIGNVAVTRGPVDVTTGGYAWTITFLNDKEPCAEHDSITGQCNSPGDVPALTVINPQLVASNPVITVCEKTANDCGGVNVNGIILRNDLNVFKVTGDPGIEHRFILDLTCQGATGGSTCAALVGGFIINTPVPTLGTALLAGDRFYLAGYSSCIFTVISVSSVFLDVVNTVCAPMQTPLTGGPFPLTIILSWNAQENQIMRVLQGASDPSLETGIWATGRKISVRKTVIGKYGAMSWLIRFISNPGLTPPGAGDISPLDVEFLTAPTCTCAISVLETQKGSIPLSGDFTIDYRSVFGPRVVHFDSTQERFERMMNEMNTLGIVRVTKFNIPSTTTGCSSTTCAGGWDGLPVVVDGTRGGYRWKVRYLKNPGDFNGFTYPPGTGNMNALTVSFANLLGTAKSVDVYTIQNGQSPLNGSFTLSYIGATSAPIAYSASAAMLEQAIEILPNVSHVTTTQDTLSTWPVPGALASIGQDGTVASISGVDIKQYFSPGDLIRFGPPITGSLIGSNGDVPITGTLSTSRVTVQDLSPVIVSTTSLTGLVFPQSQLRLGGSIYNVARTGVEVQTLTVSLTTSSWTTPNLATTFYTITMKYKGNSATSVCLPVQTSSLGAVLSGLITTMDPTAPANSITVTQSPIQVNGANSYYLYKIYFSGQYVLGDVPLITTSTTNCATLAGATAVAATAVPGGYVARQRVMLSTDSGTVIDNGGYYKLQLAAATTACLKWGDSSDAIQAALNAVLPDNVIVSRHGKGVSVTEMQQIVLTSNAPVVNGANGLFRLAYTNNGVTATTACLNYGLSATALQTALNSIGPSVVSTGHVAVSRMGDGTASWGYGYVYQIAFSGNLQVGLSNVLGNVAQLVVFSVGQGSCSPLATGVPSIQVKTTRAGQPAYTYDIFFVGSSYSIVAPLTIVQEGTCTSSWTQVGGSSRRTQVQVVNTGGSPEIQEIIIQDPVAAITGSPTFKLNFMGAATATSCLPYNAAAVDIQTALNSLTTIGANGVIVSQDIDPVRAPNGFINRVTFVGNALFGNLSPLTVITTGCSAFASATSSVSINEVQAGGGTGNELVLSTKYTGEILGSIVAYSVAQTFRVMDEKFQIDQIVVNNRNNDITGAGTYTLTLGASTTPVHWNALDTEMEIAFTVGLGIPGVTVTRRTDTALAPGGYVYTIYYSQSIGAVGTLTKTSAFTTATVTVTNIRAGSNTNLFTPTSIPLALATDSSTSASYVGIGTGLSVFKANGFQWSMLFDSSIGDIPALVGNTAPGRPSLQVFDNFIQGSPSTNLTVAGLLPGVPYYMQVSASSVIGDSLFSSPATIIPSSVSMAPQNLQAGYDMFVNEVQVVKTAARHVLEVQTVTTSTAVISEVQTLTTLASQCNNCIAGNIAYRNPTVQTITISALAPILGGSFEIVYTDTASSGTGTYTHTQYSTSALAWSSTASQVASAMVATHAFTASDIIVTREGDASVNYKYGYIFSITFVGNSVAGEVLPLAIQDTTTTPPCAACTAFSVLGGAGMTYSITQAQNFRSAMGTDTDVQRVIVKSDSVINTGGYTLTLLNAGAAMTSQCIPFNTAAADMETILQAMPNIDKVFVERSLDSTLAPNGYIYDLFFYGQGVTRYLLPSLTVVKGCIPFQTLVSNVLTPIPPANFDVTVTHVHQNAFADPTGFHSVSSTPAQLQTDLARLPILGPALFVSRSLQDIQGGFKWTIVFDQQDGNVPLFICGVDNTFSSVAAAKCTVESVIDGNTLGGYFMLGGSDPIPYNADEITMATALQELSWVGSVAVTRTGPTGQQGYTWTLSFLTFQGPMPLLVATNLLSGIGSSIQVVETVRGNALSGTFQLGFRDKVTTPIAWNAAATTVGDGSSMQEKLQAMSTIGALNINRIGPDFEGGYEWWITFTDDVKTGGDLPLLTASNIQLGGQGAVVSIREIMKGSVGSGRRLWVSFDPPAFDNGSPVTGYDIEWDSSSTFTAGPSVYLQQDQNLLFYRQKVISSAPSLSWSRTVQSVSSTIQSVAVAPTCTSFTLSFNGVPTATIAVGVTSLALVQTWLSGLSSIYGGVTVSPLVGLVTAGTSFAVTFTGQYGPQPLLVSSDTNNVISVVRSGVTNYRKEVLAFTCTGTAGSITITVKTLTATFPFSSLLSDVETGLETLLAAPSGSITVTTPSQPFVCAATPQVVTIIFHRTYGALSSGVTGAGGAVVALNPTSTAGIYVYPVSAMSGTFQLAFQGSTTPPMNSQSSAMDIRVALETLSGIQTAAVTRSLSFQIVSGTVDAQQGQMFVTCSAGQTCNFATLRYGIPGVPIYIGGTWYTVLSDLVSPDMPSSQLYLGDLNLNPTAYQGATATGIPVYEWAKGYIWTVDLLLLSDNTSLSMLLPRQTSLNPLDSNVIVQGDSCNKCYYMPTNVTEEGLIMGSPNYIRVEAENANGKSTPSPVVFAIPRQIPDAPNAINVVVVSGTEVEIFFSPPSATSSRTAPNYNSDITSYIIQWDTSTTFKHGLSACRSCATAFDGTIVTVTSDLTGSLRAGSRFTMGNMNCPLTIASLSPTALTVSPNSCTAFVTAAYDIFFYVFPPVALSGLPIQGTPPYRYLIQSLTISTTYYIRIAAVNSVPVQAVAVSGSPPDNRQWTFPISVTTSNVLPDPPLSALLLVISCSGLELQIQPALRDGQGQGGLAITGYSIDVDTVSTFSSAGRAYPVDVPVASFTQLYPGGPLTYYIQGLTTGTPYFVQVKAKTSIGYSRATITSNSLAPTCGAGPPTNVAMSTLSKLQVAPITTATVQWAAPLNQGGLTIRSYHVEWWTTAARSEVQVVELKWTTAPTALTFTLAFGGALSASMPFDISAANMRNSLMNIGGTNTPTALPIGSIQVTRTAVNVNQGYQWSVTFVTALRDQPMLQMAVGTSTGGAGIQNRVFEAVSGVAGGTTTTPGTPEVQVLTLTQSNLAQSITGFFRLSFMGSSWSTYIPATASPLFVQNVLQELFTVGQVTVNSLNNPVNPNFPANMIGWRITFNSVVGNVPALNVDSTKLLPATSVSTVYDGNNAVLPDGSWCTGVDVVCQGIYNYVRIGEQPVGYGFYDTNVPTVLTYTITGLTTGTSYYSSVTALNTLGLGVRAASYPTSIIPPIQIPSQPTSVTVGVKYGISTQLVASWSAPVSNGGSPILKYTVEYDTSPAFTTRGSQDVWCPVANIQAVWRITASKINLAQAAPLGAGWFQLKLTRANTVTTTDPIPYNAVAMGGQELGAQPAQSLVYCTACASCTDTCDVTRQQKSGSLQYKLQSLPNINGVVVTQSAQRADGGYVWSITFQDSGDDFSFEPIASVQSLNCAGNTCANSDYSVAAAKVTAGVTYPTCTGPQVIPAVGALTKGQLYYVRVSAFNSIGYSLPQMAPNPQKPMVVPGLPTGVTLQVNSVSSLKVVFSPPSDDGGDTVTSYLVTWSMFPDFRSSSSTIINILSGGAPYFCLINGLTKGQFYYVQVAAQNSQGTGVAAPSSPASLNPHTVPSAPTFVVLGITSPSMLTVAWQPPVDNGGDTITGYIVEWDTLASYNSLNLPPDKNRISISDVTQRSYTISLLTQFTAYYVRVFAVNSLGAGTGQDASLLPGVPDLVRPGKPITLTAAAVTTPVSGIYVQWQPPYIPDHGIPCFGSLSVPLPCPNILGISAVFGGVPLNNYVVEWATSSIFPGTNTKVSSGNNLYLLPADGLVSGTTYYVRVQAVNQNSLVSAFCQRSNVSPYLCPDNLLLYDGSYSTGTYVIATMP